MKIASWAASKLKCIIKFSRGGAPIQATEKTPHQNMLSIMHIKPKIMLKIKLDDYGFCNSGNK